MADEQALVRTANRRAIEEALARLREGARSEPPLWEFCPNHGEVFELECVCAVDERRYILCFERKTNGMLRFSKSVKLDGGRGIQSTAGGRAAIRTLSLKEFELSATPCPWCGDGSFNYCSHCDAYVCSGRKRGRTFHCRPSCRAEWVGVPLEEVRGERREGEPEWTCTPPRRSAGPARSPSPSPVNKNALHLPAKSTALDIRHK